MLLLAAMMLALAASNTALAPLYQAVHHAPIHFRIGPLALNEPAIAWINEGLMVFFFLQVGLEIKHQLLEGALASPKRAALPLLAALGGMAVPALVYVLFNRGDATTVHGWAIPTATDIVLALAVLSFLGDRVPAGLRIFLTALAIFDDLGGVLLIGFFYGGEVARLPLAVALLAAAGLALAGRFQVTRPVPFAVLGLVLWAAMLESGIPAALAGVVIAFAVPLHGRSGEESPLRAVEQALQPWVGFLVVPAFGFFNAGIAIDAAALAAAAIPVALGVALGLSLGKPVGIAAAVWLAVRAGAAELPAGVGWRHVHGAACVAGIGFTVSLYIAALAFSSPALGAAARLGVLAGSLLSAAIGLVVLAGAAALPDGGRHDGRYRDRPVKPQSSS